MKNKKKVLSQGDVVWLDFSEGSTLGHEQMGRRPALVVSNDKFNYLNGGLVKVIPITTTSNQFPYLIEIPEKFKVEGKLMVNQERTVDVISRNYEFFCHLPKEFVKKIIEILLTSF